MIVDKIKFYTGLGMLTSFTLLLVLMFSPVFDGKNALEYSDELYNSISKDSAYYIPDVKEDSEDYIGTSISVTLEMKTEEYAAQTSLLYQQSGAEVVISGHELAINGDLGRILETCLEDADAMYHNHAEQIADKYGYHEKQVLYNWWNSLESIKEVFDDEGMFEETKIVTSAKEKAVEPSYNYYGIEPENITDRIGIVIFSLIFYVVYTVWYGVGMMNIIEGLGLQIRRMFPFSFMARVRLTNVQM
jgi:hypothetical protein